MHTEIALCVCYVYIHTSLNPEKLQRQMFILLNWFATVFHKTYVYMFISTLTLPSAIITRQWAGENGNSQAVDPVVRHRYLVWTLQLHSWYIQNQLSGKQQGSAIYYSSPSSPQIRSLTSHSTFTSVNESYATLHWTQGTVSRYQGSDPHTEHYFAEAQIKKNKISGCSQVLFHLYCSNLICK